MKAEKQMLTAVRAGYPYFFGNTVEMNRSVALIEKVLRDFEKVNGDKPFQNIHVWEFSEEEQSMEDMLSETTTNAGELSGSPDSVLPFLERAEPYTVVIAKNFNWFLIPDTQGGFNKGYVQELQNKSETYGTSADRKVLIVLSDTGFESAIPAPLQKDFLPLEFSLPENGEIKEVIDNIAKAASESIPDFKKPTEEEEQALISSSTGLTRRALRNALTFSLIENEGQLSSETVAKMRAAEVEKAAGLKIGSSTLKFDSLKGYDNIKSFVLDTIYSPHAKGILLLGPPGTGKTHFCECLAGETGRVTIKMEMAELFGGTVGKSEELMRESLAVVKANPNCILFIDEIEKGLAGMKGGSNDGGTTKRSMGQLLKFLSDERPEGLYVIATCNDITGLPPEWLRAERWDCAPWFIDLPNEKEQAAILEYYKEYFEVSGAPKTMDGWSGAEIRTACRIARMISDTQEKEVEIQMVDDVVIPISITMEKEIKALRKEAKGKTNPASKALLPVTKKKKKSTRAIDV